MRTTPVVVLTLLALPLGACPDHTALLDTSPGLDVLLDTSTPPVDLGVDVPADTGTDAATDTGSDAGVVTRLPLGAVPGDGGVAFGVWAPAATAATVSGDFGDVDMVREDGGVFRAFVPGATVGQAYRYQLVNAGRTLTRTDPRALELRSGAAVVADPGAYAWRTPSFTPPSLRQAVIYELHVGSFAVAAGARAGTYADVAARLDGLVDLGVNVLELMPTNEFGGTGWGYNPKLYLVPNTGYGTPDELRRLVDEAHARGMAVLQDVVYNHYSGSSTSPLVCFDGDCPTGTYGPYFFRDAPYRSTPWGPRPDYTRPEVVDLLLDGVATWVRDYRMDGFRWDSVSNIRALDGMGTVPGGRDLLLRAHALTRALRPGALVIAEDLKGYDALTRPAADRGGFAFDTQWDGFVYTLADVLVGSSDDARNLSSLRDAVLGRYNGDAFQRVICSETHDTVGNGSASLPQRIDPVDPGSFAARKRSMLAAALVFTSPGVPMLFMGQEHLEVGSFTDPARPLDWTREEGHARVRSFYRTLVRMRRNLDGGTPGLLGGNVAVIHYHDLNKVLAFRRWDRGGDDVVVIANLRNRAYTRYDIGLPAGGTWRVRIDSDDPRWSTDFHGTAPATIEAQARMYDGLPYTGSIVLGPWSVVVLSRDP